MSHVREPAHWFDFRMPMEDEEAVLIEVIDEVYLELTLANRVSSYRRGVDRMLMESDPTPEPAESPQEMLKEMQELLRKYGY